MSNGELISYYLANGDLLIQNSIIQEAIRGVGWWVFKAMVKIADACQSLYDVTFGLVDFTTWPKINEFVANFKPLFIALMAVSLFALGVMLVFNHEKKPKIVINICVAILCVTCSTMVFQQMNDIVHGVKSGIDAVAGQQNSENVYDIVGENLYDIYYIDQQIGLSAIDYDKNAKDLPHPKMTKQKFGVINYSEVLDPDNDNYDFNDSDAKDILSQTLIAGGDGDSYEVEELYNGFAWSSMGNEFYYRYNLDVFPTVIQLCALIILYIALSYKCTRIAFELVFGRLLAYLYSAELSGGQKIAKVLYFIRDSYILLLITTLCIKLFYFFSAYVGEVVDNTIAESFILIFIAFCVIDGPNLVEKLLGMDAGLNQSTARMVAAYKFGKAGANIAAAPGRAAYNYARRRHAENRQRDNTSEAFRNAMGSTDQQNTDTAFMDGDGKNNSTGNSEQQKNGKTSADQNTYSANTSTNGQNEQGKNGTVTGAAFATGNFGNTDFMEEGGENGISAFEHGSESDNTAFMDENNNEPLTPADMNGNIENDTSFMSDDKFKGEMENNYPEAAMDTPNTEVVNAAASMQDISESPDAKDAEKGMNDNDRASSHADEAKEPQIQQKAMQGQPAGQATDKSHTDTDRATFKNPKSATTGTDSVRKPDKWDAMMKDIDEPKERESSMNRVKSQYKGHIFDRNFDDKGEKGDKE